jgi:hypothetical protein
MPAALVVKSFEFRGASADDGNDNSLTVLGVLPLFASRKLIVRKRASFVVYKGTNSGPAHQLLHPYRAVANGKHFAADT